MNSIDFKLTTTLKLEPWRSLETVKKLNFTATPIRH